MASEAKRATVAEMGRSILLLSRGVPNRRWAAEMWLRKAPVEEA